ncbi:MULTISPECIES: hypothetical protein [Bacteria]|uniref:Uncharacterized protein n=3 Tax=Streptomyces griseus group TaxID=629295 RepID=A0ABW6EAJ8_9ACTN
MEEKKQIGPRITVETFKKLELLAEHFTKHNEFGRVSKDAVIEFAIKELYRDYLGKGR